MRKASAERIESVRENSAVLRFLTAPEFAAEREGVRALYAQKGIATEQGVTPEEDFIRTAFRVIGDDTVRHEERMEMLQGFTGLAHREASQLLDSLSGMFYADQLSLRGAERDATDLDARPALPDAERFQRERLTTGSDAGRVNAVRNAFDQHAPDWDQRQTRWIDSARHLAVRDAVDKATGSRNLDPGLDPTEISAFADRERAAAVERLENHEPSLRDTLAGAFDQHEENGQ
jgi:hypothetical protein